MNLVNAILFSNLTYPHTLGLLPTELGDSLS